MVRITVVVLSPSTLPARVKIARVAVVEAEAATGAAADADPVVAAIANAETTTKSR
jgi:hypothetical protein